MRRIVAIWTLPALADIVDTYLSTVKHGAGPHLGRVALLIAPGWYAWAAMTPAILWLSKRFPPRRYWLAHIAASVVAISLHVGVIWAVGRTFDPTERFVSGRATYGDTLENWAPVSMFIYWSVVVAAGALESRRRASALSEELARTQLAALRAQLHPHFLFNALNSAVSLVRVGKPEDGVRVLTDLSDILRHMLRDTTSHEVPLREEIALIERYLDIERTRFGDALSVALHVDEVLRDALVPALILQPLVENAIRHGQPTSVAVEACADGSVLTLRVRDNGTGLAPGWDGHPGVGLRNTRARLAGLYGEGAQLRVTGAQTGGVEAAVTLPLRFAHDSRAAG
jgi:signal transduction histidine kinase